jgi:hypothetical protein
VRWIPYGRNLGFLYRTSLEHSHKALQQNTHTKHFTKALHTHTQIDSTSNTKIKVTAIWQHRSHSNSLFLSAIANYYRIMEYKSSPVRLTCNRKNGTSKQVLAMLDSTRSTHLITFSEWRKTALDIHMCAGLVNPGWLPTY